MEPATRCSDETILCFRPGYHNALDFAKRRPLRIWFSFTLFFNQDQKKA
jgi:hypothetical protein